MRFIVTFLFLINAFALDAKGTFEFSPNVESAYQLTLSLQLDAARQQLSYETYQNPDNLLTLLIEDYIDFFTIFINEDKAEFDKLKANKERRLRLIREGSSDSPYYLYAQAEITLHWALTRLKFEENLTAAREVRRAYKLLEENSLKYPDFMANKKTLGLLHAIIGTIPDNYRWAVKMVGMDGTVEQGKRELQEVIRYAQVRPDFLFGQETIVMYALMMMYIGNSEAEAWAIVSNADMDVENNPLAAFILANVAMHNGRNDEAIDILQRAPRGEEYHNFHYLDFMLGLGKLYRLDADADEHLYRYVNNFKGQNYIKEAYQKIAWYELLFGTKEAYRNNMLHCKSNGKAIMESDKKAEKEAIEGLIPQRDLVKARLLFDGGYYDKSLNILRAKTENDFDNPRQRLEYLYRLGRVYHKKNNDKKAIKYYQQIIHEGSDKPWYFACNAALRMGNVYEAQGNYAQARVYYKKCLNLYPDEYRNGLHQHAKAGLSRIKRN